MDFDQRLANPRERIYLPEVLAEVSKAKTKERKIELLQAFAKKNTESYNLVRDFVQSTFHPQVVLDLPESEPPYESVFPDYNLAPNTLSKSFKRIPYFVKGHSMYIELAPKRERLYIQTLESLFKADAELFIMVKDKRIDAKKYKGVTEALFREAFPGFLPELVKSPKS